MDNKEEKDKIESKDLQETAGNMVKKVANQEAKNSDIKEMEKLQAAAGQAVASAVNYSINKENDNEIDVSTLDNTAGHIITETTNKS